ncbi:hypothetical protein [Ralstonia sp. ASV6]|uniref:hypothetical protein n=1 Tax=Ralstonia sp. ASV6 TaxID=2795124 RepID=UPI0018ED7F76|nr:hypothetical protein [Ralstonia sp. ASV6]
MQANNGNGVSKEDVLAALIFHGEDPSGSRVDAVHALVAAQGDLVGEDAIRRAVDEQRVHVQPNQILPPMAADLRQARSLFEQHLAKANAGLNSKDYSGVQFPRTGVLAAIELHTRASCLNWVLEMLPDVNTTPVKKGEVSIPLTPEVMAKEINWGRDLFEKELAKFRDSLNSDDLSVAQFPRVGDDARVELDTRVKVLNWVLEMTPNPARYNVVAAAPVEPEVGAPYRFADDELEGTVFVKAVSGGRVYYEGDAEGSAELGEFVKDFKRDDEEQDATHEGRPSWEFVCEHFGLDECFQYTEQQREEYYSLLEQDASEDVKIVELALGNLTELLADPCSADREHMGAEKADRWVARGKEMLNDLGNPARVNVAISIPAQMPEFSAEQSFNPKMQVARFEQAMKAWRVADESASLVAGPNERDAVVLMLADLRHYCDVHGLNFGRLDREAYTEYVNDKNRAREENVSPDVGV